jgi:hypothetical protein
MPPFVALALLGVGLYAGYRWFARMTQDLAADMRRAEEELARRASGKPIEKDLGTLEFDPASGVYKPARRG